MMKRFFSIALSFYLGLHGAKAQLASPEALLKQLNQAVENGKFYFGHHDDTVYGHTWVGDEERSDIMELTGKYPGLMSWDLGLIEWQCDNELDGVPFSRIREEVVKQDARGGINTFSWHLRNPLTKGDAWDVKGITADPATRPVSQVLKEGSALNDTLRTWIGRAADFIGSLRRTNGTRIPVIFRPWHEHTGSWFWWGKDFCSPEEYRQLWQLTRRVFEAHGIDNVVWAWSPDVVSSYSEYVERFPGAEFVDIVGADVYHRDGAAGTESYLQRLNTTLSAAQRAATDYHKVMALTETGSESLPIANWYTHILLPTIQQYPIAYVCVWRNAHNIPTHFYTPFKGHKAAKDFFKFCKNKKVIMIRREEPIFIISLIP